MLYLQKNGDSIIVLTLKEKSELAEPYYTFLFENKDSREDFVIAAPDLSPYPEVYNKFVITIDDDNPRPDLGKINLSEGQYNYTVYESPNPREVEIENCSKIVEVGILYVGYPEQTDKVTIVPTDDTKIYRG